MIHLPFRPAPGDHPLPQGRVRGGLPPDSEPNHVQRTVTA